MDCSEIPGSSSSKASTSSRSKSVLCNHNCPTITKIAGTPNNMGRSFFRCPYWQDKHMDCGFFRWADDRTKELGLCTSQTGIDRGEWTEGLDMVIQELRDVKRMCVVLENRIGYVVVVLLVVVVLICVGLLKA
ncbi:hypothetical protein LINPERHAP2_LOCUS14174 [Linum perenne]